MIRSILSKHPDLFGLHPQRKKLGIGENHNNFLINNKYVLRISFHSEKSVNKEFKRLQRVPKEFSPPPLLCRKNYIILPYVRGKHIQKWSTTHIQTHARALARLHRKTAQKGTYDIVKDFRKEMLWFEKMIDISSFPVREVEKILKAQSYLFTKRTQIHFDPCLTNILFNQGKVHYIDWEWTKIGDPALDVSMLYFEDIPCYPWRMRLSGERLDLYLSTYRKIRKDKTLHQRARLWQLYFKLLELLYFTYKIQYKKIKKGQLPASFYKRTIKILSTSLQHDLKLFV